MKQKLIFALFLLIMLFNLIPGSVEATDAHECTYLNASNAKTLSFAKGTYAGAMRGKITHFKFKDAVFNGGDELDQNMSSLAMEQATGICPQSAAVVKKAQIGLDDYIIYTGNEADVKNWVNSNYANENYEISKLQGTAKNIIDRMNQVNTKDHTWWQYPATYLDCSYNKGQTKVKIYQNYFEAVKQLGRGGEWVCPSYIYQYCDANDTSYCAYSFFPEEQYLCQYNMFTCKKIDVNGITDAKKKEPSPTVEPKKKSVNLFLQKANKDWPGQLNMVVNRNEKDEISTTLTMTGNIKAALVGTGVSRTQLRNFVSDDKAIMTEIDCATYDKFVNNRNEKYSYDTNFSGGNLSDYSYVCVLHAEESIVWQTGWNIYTVRQTTDLKKLALYDRLVDMDKCDNYDELDGTERDECQKSQKFLYDEAIKARNLCKKSIVDFSLKCDLKNGYINQCEDDCCVCSAMLDLIDSYAKDGYFGNRIISSGSGGDDCTGILGSLGKWLSRIYNILKLAVPAIIVAMGFKDFIQGMSSGNDDALKKAGTTFIKRLVVGAVFVMLPLLIKMILTFAFGGSFSDICITL